MLYFSRGGVDISLSDSDIETALKSVFQKIEAKSPLNKVLAIPPDITRLHSRAGQITAMADRYFGPRLSDILPALGTHFPMADDEILEMFPGVDRKKFRDHRWREDLVTLGRVPAEYLKEISEGRVDYDWPAQVNRMLVEGGHDLIISVGQVVPHEVIGFANHNKNIFVGTGGAEGIHKSHYLGAVYGMERVMGHADSPVRRVLNYASDHFAEKLPAILYVLTVVAPDETGKLHVRGLFIGDGYECYNQAAALSREVNFIRVEKPFSRAVVYLDPKEFRSTWLGNKSIYRTRMAMADDGLLTVIAPGLEEFGEDPEIDRLIRKYGYYGTTATLAAVEANADLRNNLSAAAHFIHGSSEGRFRVRYAPGGLNRAEIESAGYEYAGIAEVKKELNITDINNMNNGYYRDAAGEEYYFISNPALGLWAYMD